MARASFLIVVADRTPHSVAAEVEMSSNISTSSVEMSADTKTGAARKLGGETQLCPVQARLRASFCPRATGHKVQTPNQYIILQTVAPERLSTVCPDGN